MKRSLLLILLFFTFAAFAQEDAWVYFTGKPDAAYFMANPLQMLSQRSLDRRTAQNIPLDDKDVPVNQGYIDQVTAASGITVMAKSRWLNALHIRGSQSDINALTALPFVASIDFASNLIGTGGKSAVIQQSASVNKVMDGQVIYNYGNSASQVQMLNGHLLHQQEYTGTDKVIAVLDSGFPGVNNTQPFQRLRDNNKILGGYNYVSRSDNVYTGHFHGTYVLSTMGGYVENQLVGTAPDASYYLFVTENAASENPVEESLWVEAAEMADSLGVDVINTSLGYFIYDNPAYSYTYNDINGNTAFITRGANVAFSRGIICVTSAGNTGATANPHITVPADALNTLTVGAVDANEVISSFSSTGPSFDGRVKPDVVAQGVASVVSDVNGNIITAGGTSFSSPITAGLVACLWQALPQKTNAEILQLVRASANKYTTPNAQYGYGVPDFNLALQNGLGLESVVKPQLLLYPGIINTAINVVFPADIETISITVFNNLGQRVLHGDIAKSNPSISAEALATGIYSYRISTGAETKTGRIIKQ